MHVSFSGQLRLCKLNTEWQVHAIFYTDNLSAQIQECPLRNRSKWMKCLSVVNETGPENHAAHSCWNPCTWETPWALDAEDGKQIYKASWRVCLFMHFFFMTFMGTINAQHFLQSKKPGISTSPAGHVAWDLSCRSCSLGYQPPLRTCDLRY